jgi:2-oxoglutarate dehydrogenase E2 component (dihydrolipoamide succinyltransferase)
MATDIKVPTFPESITDGTIAAWRKQPGEAVKLGEIVADIETDKVVFEVPATEDGVLTEILAPVGATVVSAQVIGQLASGAAAVAAPARASATSAGASAKGGATVMPSARKLMSERGVEPAQVSGSGKGGRVLKEDVLKVIESRPAAAVAEKRPTAPERSVAPEPRPVVPVSLPTPSPSLPPEARPEKRVPMTRLRARIAERLVEAQRSAAMLTTFNEVNMSAVSELRERYRERFEKQYGVRLGFMSFFVKACIEALRRFPEVNASIDGNDIVYHGFYDIGIAVSSPRGLVVPILRDADQMDMATIEARIREFGQKAKDGKLTLEEITGGTFSITNGGVFGSLLSTPILNPPQSAILGMHKIEERPLAENGQVVVRPMMYLALSYDHRIVDGREAVQFLVTIKDVLEDPARMLMGI